MLSAYRFTHNGPHSILNGPTKTIKTRRRNKKLAFIIISPACYLIYAYTYPNWPFHSQRPFPIRWARHILTVTISVLFSLFRTRTTFSNSSMIQANHKDMCFFFARFCCCFQLQMYNATILLTNRLNWNQDIVWMLVFRLFLAENTHLTWPTIWL